MEKTEKQYLMKKAGYVKDVLPKIIINTCCFAICVGIVWIVPNMLEMLIKRF
jgi:hypothetical protein